MKTMRLGDTGAEVSALCLGAMNFGTKLDEKGSFKVLDRYYEAGGASELTIALRVPGWCRTPTLLVNGERAAAPSGADGYLRVRRRWVKGDTLALTLPMTVERIHADPRVRADIGKVALQRGPIVYCLEEADNGPGLAGIRLPVDAPLEVTRSPEVLGGVVTIRATGRSAAAWTGPLYSAGGAPGFDADRPLLFIPYYAWANRAPGEMTVWVRE